MTDFDAHLALYGSLRGELLARHFALGRFHRANLLSECNRLDPPPEDVPADDGPAIVAKWQVATHDRENPLLYGALLQAALAVEHRLGSPDAGHILQRNLEAVASLVCLEGPAAGWITRWDAATSDNWTMDGDQATRCEDFLIDEAGSHLRCTPTTDPRHIAWRGRAVRLALHTAREADALLPADGSGGLHYEYVSRRRAWEPSMDELAGLFGGWAIADALVPAVRPLLRPAAGAVAGRLAAHGYTVVRPCGGFGSRGSTGMLGAFEVPIDGWMRHIGGAGAPAAVNFEGALALAGYAAVVQPRLAQSRAQVALLGPAAAGLISALLPLLGPLGGTVGGLLGLVGTRLGPEAVALALATNDCCDVFDPHHGQSRGEPVMAALLSSLTAGERLQVYFQFLGLGAGGSASNFPPYLALTAYGDAGAAVREPYLVLMRERRAQAPKALASSGLDCAFATAVAVLLGAQDLVPTLAAQLEERHLSLAVNGGGVRSVPADASDDLGKAVWDEFHLVLDYLAALALAWLHDAEAPGPKVLSRAPTAADMAGLPPPVVPAAVLKHLPDVRGLVLGPDAPPPYADTPLFSGAADRAKDAPPTAVLPTVPDSAVVDFIFELGRWTGDLPTGVYLQDGDDYEIHAMGQVDGLDAAGGALVTDAAWPVHAAIDPQARVGCVLGRLDDYFVIGKGCARRRYLPWHGRRTELVLRINRPDRRRRPEESFFVHVRIWGSAPSSQLTGRYVACADHAHNGHKGRRVVSAIGGYDAAGRRWWLEVGRAMQLITECGQIFRVHGPQGARLTVVHGKYGNYLRTVADGAEHNNLKSLVVCTPKP